MKILICTVGGSSAPILQSINIQQPDIIIYIASLDSRQSIRSKIEAELKWKGFKDTHIITLSNHQDLLTCVRDIRNGIDKAFDILGFPQDTVLIADITGGTKVMSSALTLVMMEYSSQFTYIGGKERTKDGLGTVVDGHEVFMPFDNPWEIMAFREVQKLCDAFNSWEFTSALFFAKEVTQNIGEEKEKFYQCMIDLIEGYAAWDAFDHKSAQNKLQQVIGRFKPYTMQSSTLNAFLQQLTENKKILDAVQEDASILRASKSEQNKKCGRAYLLDLVANAKRRCEKGRYDDAVARLYSAIEKIAKITLMSDFGIDNSKVDLERVPSHLHEGLLLCANSDGCIQIPLHRSFQLLDDLEHDLGKLYGEHVIELDKQLHTRNLSLLAHGYNPVTQQACEKLLTLALAFLNIKEDELPTFITLDWKTFIL